MYVCVFLHFVPSYGQFLSMVCFCLLFVYLFTLCIDGRVFVCITAVPYVKVSVLTFSPAADCRYSRTHLLPVNDSRWSSMVLAHVSRTVKYITCY